jgi:hypothetical protein
LFVTAPVYRVSHLEQLSFTEQVIYLTQCRKFNQSSFTKTHKGEAKRNILLGFTDEITTYIYPRLAQIIKVKPWIFLSGEKRRGHAL